MFGKPANRNEKRPQAGRHARHLSRAVILEEVGPPVEVRGLILLCSVLLLGVIVWAGLTSVTQMSRAPAEVAPGPSMTTVQHLEGGIVAKVLVEEGELVPEGHVLVVLDDTMIRAALNEVVSQRRALELRQERLLAFAEERAPVFAAAPVPQRPAQAELAVLKQQRTALADELSVVQQQQKQRESELRALEKRQASLSAKAAVHRETLQIRSGLMEKGLVSRIVYLQSLDQYQSAAGEASELISQIERAKNSVAESRDRAHQVLSSRRNEARQEASQVDAQIGVLMEQENRLADRLTRLEVRAPVRGLVMGLGVRLPGAIVPAGGRLLDIVPADGALIIEARIPPSQIGQIRPGLPAEVYLSTYDHARLGPLIAEVFRLSATTYFDSSRQPYYKGELRIRQPYVGNTPGIHPVLPGMTGEVRMITGERTIIEYLLRPVVQSLSTAFSER